MVSRYTRLSLCWQLVFVAEREDDWLLLARRKRAPRLPHIKLARQAVQPTVDGKLKEDNIVSAARRGIH
jgi:hypothetical protein